MPVKKGRKDGENGSWSALGKKLDFYLNGGLYHAPLFLLGAAHLSGGSVPGKYRSGPQARNASPDRRVLHCQRLCLGGLIKPSITLVRARDLMPVSCC